MKLFLSMIILVLLVGCTAPVQQQEKFNVSLLNALHEDVFISETNKTLDGISFVIQNNEHFDIDCFVFLSMDNTTNKSTQKGHVGVLTSSGKKNVSMNFEMFYGETDLKVYSECEKH